MVAELFGAFGWQVKSNKHFSLFLLFNLFKLNLIDLAPSFDSNFYQFVTISPIRHLKLIFKLENNFLLLLKYLY